MQSPAFYVLIPFVFHAATEPVEAVPQPQRAVPGRIGQLLGMVHTLIAYGSPPAGTTRLGIASSPAHPRSSKSPPRTAAARSPPFSPICLDLGIEPGQLDHAAWVELCRDIIDYRGNLVTLQSTRWHRSAVPAASPGFSPIPPARPAPSPQSPAFASTGPP